VRLHYLDGEAPFVTWTKDGAERRLDCDFIAGCDSYHGANRSNVPADVLKIFEHIYPIGWRGILADLPARRM